MLHFDASTHDASHDLLRHLTSDYTVAIDTPKIKVRACILEHV